MMSNEEKANALAALVFNVNTLYDWYCAKKTAETKILDLVEDSLQRKLPQKMRNVLIEAGRHTSEYQSVRRAYYDLRRSVRTDLKALGIDQYVIHRMTTFEGD